jgi:hypothetical protein
MKLRKMHAGIQLETLKRRDKLGKRALLDSCWLLAWPTPRLDIRPKHTWISSGIHILEYRTLSVHTLYETCAFRNVAELYFGFLI